MSDPNAKRHLHFTQTASGAALTNSTARTSILHASAKGTIPGGFLDVGKQLLIRASGKISNVVTTPGTLTLDINFLKTGPTNVIVATSQAMGLNVVAKTDVGWYLEWLLTCLTVGSGTSATFMHQGKWHSESVVGSPAPSAGGSGMLSIPASAPAAGTGFDSTADQAIDLFATFSVNTATTSITCTQFSMTSIGPG